MKRIVTYLYEYHNGKKGNNVGFIKVDLRGMECRLQLHVQGAGKETETGKVYLVMKGEQAQAVCLGGIKLQQGACEMVWRFSRLRVMDSDYELSQVAGVGILFPSGRYLASSWIDEPTREFMRGTFREWKRPEEISSEAEKAENPKKEEYMRTGRESTQQENTEDRAGEFAEAQDGARMMGNASEGAEESAEAQDGARLAGSASEGAEESAEAQNGARLAGSASVRAKEPVEAQGGARLAGSASVRAKEPAEEQDDARLAGSGNIQAEKISLEGEERTEGKNRIILQPELQDLELRMQELKKMGLAYENEDACADEPVMGDRIRKIDINYIRKLPKRNWYLCNNSFLIHGFFNYHYLVIRETERDGIKKMYLGVPGIYERPERAMALLFGFPEFIPEKGDEAEKSGEEDGYEQGTFGYWYCLLDI